MQNKIYLSLSYAGYVLLASLLSSCGSDAVRSTSRATSTPSSTPTVVQDANPCRTGRWWSPKLFYQSTQVIPVNITAGYILPSDEYRIFQVLNASTLTQITPDNALIKVGPYYSQGYSYSFLSDYSFQMQLYPYAKVSKIADTGMNTLVLKLSDDGCDVLGQPVFEIKDFTSFWFLSSTLHSESKSSFWMDATARPTTASDGSMLISTGTGSGILFR